MKNWKAHSDKTAIEKLLTYAARGFAIGAFKNARFIIKFGGRKSNIVSVFDKTVRSSLGNPKWFARVDAPHRNVPFYHINVNKAITGVMDPHIEISESMAQAAGDVAIGLDLINKVAPVLMTVSVACDIYGFACEAKKDYKHGSTRNTIQKVATVAARTGGGLAGSATGASIGSTVFPGVGTLVGGLVGGVCEGIGGGTLGETSTEYVLYRFTYNIDDLKAPVLMVASLAYDAYQIGCEVKKDIENHSSRNTIQKTVSTVAATGGGLAGCGVGASLGTAIFPGVGTLIGGFVGGISGGVRGGIGGEVASEVVLEILTDDIDDLICEECVSQYQHRRYEEGPHQKCCPNCR